jgi:flagellar protein FliL
MAEADEAEHKGKKKRGKLVLIAAVPLVLALIGAGLWFTGVLPRLLGHAPEQHAKAETTPQPVFVDLPEIVANLDSNTRQPAFIKLKARLELARPEDQAAIAAAMPRILDLFQTYLRETRPEDLRGSAGTYRLREELIGRASIAAAPARVTDVLFTQVLVQ